MMLEERGRWDALLARAGDAGLTEPGLPGGWSVKDVIAHVIWGEREIAGVFQQHALVGSDLWDLPLRERNAAIYEQNRDRSLDEVLADAPRAFTELVEAVQQLSEDDLNDPSLYRDMPADWEPWRLIAENTYEHYRDHMPAIEAWLGKKAQES